MPGKYNCIVHYDVTATCVTPLRTANADGDTEMVLRRSDGTGIIQGSSLAGAMKHFAAQEWTLTRAEELFGSQKAESRLIVSDGVFAKSAEMQMRPRICIDAASGSVENKFDIAHIGVDETFDFSVTWRGNSLDSDDIVCVERIFAAIQSGALCFGAQKSNGFGQVSLSVKKGLYDLREEKARRAWLDEATEWRKTIKLAQYAPRQVIFEVSGKTNSILVKASAPELRTAENGKDVSTAVAVNIKENGKSILPGSSVKGAIRARAEMIAEYLKLPNSTNGIISRMFGCGSDGREDNGVPGRVWFEDAVLDDTAKTITRIRINRFTGGVMNGALIKEEPRSSSIRLRIKADESPEQCALLLLALRDLGLGLYTFGSGSAIGRGYVTVEKITAKLPDGRKGSLSFDKEKHCAIDDQAGIFPAWLKELEALK